MATPSDVGIYLSGGAANTNPALSLGGARSTTELTSQTATPDTGIAGVTLGYAACNNPGAGTLRFEFATTQLFWHPFGGTEGAGVDVSADGDYVLSGGNDESFLAVSVIAASLPGADDTDTVTIAHILNNLFGDLSEQDSKLGQIVYRAIYFVNNAAETITLIPYFKNPSSGSDTVYLAWDAVGQTVSIVDEFTAPVTTPALAWNSPLSTLQADSITLESAEEAALWFKRELPAPTVDRADPARFNLAIEVNA